MKVNFKFKLSPLPYKYGDLEPYVGQKTMKLHHTRHLGTYINELNEALSRHPEFNGASLTEIYRTDSDGALEMRELCAAVYNHNLFFSLLAPSTNGAIRVPVGELRRALIKEFGSIERTLIMLRDAALDSREPGWVFLCKSKNDRAEILFCRGHSIPDPRNYIPIIAIDTWEHSYYLDYLSAKKNYIENNFRLINWELSEMFWRARIAYK